MAYDWPPGWNETRTERAVQGFVCETLDVPKYAVRASIDAAREPDLCIQPVVQIFKPLGEKPTAAVHEVLGRLSAFGDPTIRVHVPREKVGDRQFRTRRIYVWELNDSG